ncbi:hypothetical protein HN51_041347 [Arachis hypogaea]|uniref:Uncharacterized protein n=1 Tax=Arachis hypogaea TaxID=3818 RepID=A0A444YS66_ARAHY|nr:uncharacterized protein LOC107604852 [Arachis ipaensis]XP_025658671.1 uncharacterized protein LOC112755021 [Arachis hypogaea]XP_057721377.1 uncharacterized protein LOC130935587 [Arachis stenosperma]QHN87092.1 2,3-bisphosphoglycerate-dependent phosphoglycerate mutase [Arachis hypogaea]RYR04772.1 hypothetical protein Ahy_B06g084547 [Arachis hypogaea]
MGANQSDQVAGNAYEEEEEEEEDEEEDEEDNVAARRGLIRPPQLLNNRHVAKKLLEQEPEILPCHASASPLSPQLSSLGTPRLGPSIKVWDPYNVLAPPPPPPMLPPPSNDADDEHAEAVTTEVFVISHGECELSLRPDLISGRVPGAGLTPNGERQARALAVFLKSQGVRFNAVYSSPLDRARSTAVVVCKEINFLEDQIQSSDALVEMSQGNWEGCLQSEIYTPEILRIIDRFQPDFAAPSGESLRQVEFRMVQFLNGIVLRLPEKLRIDLSSHHNENNQTFVQQDSHPLTNSIHDQDGPLHPTTQWDSLHRHRPGLSRKKSGKSRLQVVTNTGDDFEDDISPRQVNHQSALHNSFGGYNASVSCIGIFTHSAPIKCLLTGLLGCSPLLSQKFCIGDSSVTVLQHSLRTGWQIKRLNDTAHLRLL